MFRLFLLCVVCTTVLTACEKEKQNTPTIGAVPKQIIDKATNDINQASAINVEKLKAAENETNSQDTEK
jgi:nitrous oxide reductase accessory protein NosL